MSERFDENLPSPVGESRDWRDSWKATSRHTSAPTAQASASRPGSEALLVAAAQTKSAHIRHAPMHVGTHAKPHQHPRNRKHEYVLAHKQHKPTPKRTFVILRCVFVMSGSLREAIKATIDGEYHRQRASYRQLNFLFCLPLVPENLGFDETKIKKNHAYSNDDHRHVVTRRWGACQHTHQHLCQFQCLNLRGKYGLGNT